MRSFAVVVLLTALVVPSAYAADPVVEVTACGQIVPAKTRGILTADLDCTGSASAAVTLMKKATLDLQGFTLTGGSANVACYKRCDGGGCVNQGSQCAIVNGTITGATSNGILGDRVTITNLTITNTGRGVDTARKIVATNVTVTQNRIDGLNGDLIKISNSTVTGNGIFGLSGSVNATDSNITGNGISPECADTRCADIASPRRPRLKNTTCDTTYASVDTSTTCAGRHWCVCSIN